MKKWLIFLVICFLSLSSNVLASGELTFIENKGQWHNNVLLKSELNSGFVYLEKNRLTFDLYDVTMIEKYAHHHNHYQLNEIPNKLNWHAYNVNFKDGNPNPTIIKSEKVLAYFNYFLGNNPEKWASDVKGYKKVTYQEVYKGIDFQMYSTDNLKYDFIVKAQANPNQIKLVYNGQNKLQLKKGQLHVTTSVNTIIEDKPYAYQIINGEKRQVNCNYVLTNNELGFEFPNGYDKNYDLIIDPTLMFSSLSGSTANNFGYTATFDSKGFLYAGSSAFGTGYPVTTGAYSTTFNGGGDDIAISKFDTSGTFLIYSTYIGGSNVELPHSLIVNSFDELFILGTTSSFDYPTTANAYDNTFNGGTMNNLSNGLGVNYTNGSDIIVSRLSTNGTNLIASTYLGGSQNDGLNSTGANTLKYNYADEVRGEIDIDKNNNIYIVSCTRSSDFPIVGNVFQPTYGGGDIDACIVKMDNNLQNIIWSSFLGGSNHDAAYSLAIDSNEDLYLTGGTNSTNFPSSVNAYQNTFVGGRSDGFVTRVAKNGSQILNSTFFGSTTYDQNYFIELDKNDNVYLLGQTEITDNTFIHNVLWSNPGSGQFISKLTPTLDSLIYSTVFGSGNGINISPTAFLVDLCNKIYLAGWGGSVNQSSTNNAGYTTGMPTTSNAFQNTTDGSDFYVMVIEDDASNINYGSFFGGPVSSEHVDGGTSRFDRKGKVYQAICAGCGGNSDLPIYPPTNPMNQNNHSCNLGVFKMDFDLPVVVADFEVPPVGCAPFTVTFNNTSLTQSNTNFTWNFGDGNGSSQFSPTHTYNNPGTYTITLILNDTTTCNLADTAIKTILILGSTNTTDSTINICPGESVQIGTTPNPNPNINYNWSPTVGLSDSTISNPFASPTSSTNYQLYISDSVCVDTITYPIVVNTPLLSVTNDTTLCYNETISLSANSFGTSNTYVWSSNGNFTDTLNSPITNNTYSPPINISGTYYIQINNNGCTLSDSVAIKTIGQSSIIGADSICFGDTVSITYSNTNPGDSTNYVWSPSGQILNGQGTTSVDVSPTTTTTFTVITTNDICIDTLTQQVVVTTVQMSVSNDTTLCVGDSAVTLLASSTTSGANIFWSSNAMYSDTLNNGTDSINVSPTTTTTYYVMVSAGGCSRTDSVTVYIANNVTSIADAYICYGDTTSLTINNLNPNDSLFHDWQPNAQIISGDSTNTIIVSPVANTTFYVVSENSAGCLIWDSATVFVDMLGSLNINATVDNPTIYPRETTQLHASPNGYNYTWSPTTGLDNPNSQHPNASPTQTTTYTVTISGTNCERTASVTIEVKEIVCDEPDIFIPNAFTPNGDGENDVLFVRGKMIEKMNLKIYNRWGELVFETDNQQIGWDGKYKEELVQPNVFVYHLQVWCIDGQEFFKKGNVTVIR
jgi:gliding motility-associated-like protein